MGFHLKGFTTCVIGRLPVSRNARIMRHPIPSPPRIWSRLVPKVIEKALDTRPTGKRCYWGPTSRRSVGSLYWESDASKVLSTLRRVRKASWEPSEKRRKITEAIPAHHERSIQSHAQWRILHSRFNTLYLPVAIFDNRQGHAFGHGTAHNTGSCKPPSARLDRWVVLCGFVKSLQFGHHGVFASF